MRIGTIIWSRGRQKQSILPRIIKRNKTISTRGDSKINNGTIKRWETRIEARWGREKVCPGSDYRINRLINGLARYSTTNAPFRSLWITNKNEIIRRRLAFSFFFFFFFCKRRSTLDNIYLYRGERFHSFIQRQKLKRINSVKCQSIISPAK